MNFAKFFYLPHSPALRASQKPKIVKFNQEIQPLRQKRILKTWILQNPAIFLLVNPKQTKNYNIGSRNAASTAKTKINLEFLPKFHQKSSPSPLKKWIRKILSIFLIIHQKASNKPEIRSWRGVPDKFFSTNFS